MRVWTVAPGFRHGGLSVVATEWPLYREVDLIARTNLVVLDANRFRSATLEGNPNIHYVTIGKGAP